MKIDDLRTELDELNLELAQLTDQAPLTLQYLTGEADEDSLFLYGIIGGKDVGKTSLINQLAGARISIDTDILDEGTSKAVAYCHESDIASLKKRLPKDMSGRIEYAAHQHDVLRNVVLVDFPDYDSRFEEHRDDVKRLSRSLQGLVWVITPRKYGDHEFVDQLEAVAQSHDNYLIILNKTDQLDGRVDLETARREVLQYLQDECSRRNIPAPTGDRLLLLSTLHTDRYEYHRLYDKLIRRHSQEEIINAKVDNLRTEFEKNLVRLNNYYSLSEKISQLDLALDDIADSLSKYFNEEYFETVWRRILSLSSIQHRISHGLFFERVQNWPILRLIFHPLAGLVSFIGGRLSMKGDDAMSENPRDLLRQGGQSASSLLQNIRVETEEHYPELSAYLDEPQSFSSPVNNSFVKMLGMYEEKVVKRISASFPKPGVWRKSLVFLPLIWFPIIQPILLHLAESETSLFSLSGIGEAFSLLISLFGAGALLQSVVFLVIFYLLWLVFMYANGARRALKEGEEEFRDLWFENFIPIISSILTRPFESVRNGWLDKQNRLDGIRTDIINELLRIKQS
jgi:hypothetical protein